ncbi:MAG TPA: Gfo/Idh/MocA family oxidoreductase [Caulobacterales bacterium]|nr:Gfo/Idh/MocA family oxidoreductase [Caulobacterales bacterium]
MSSIAVVGCGYWGRNLVRNFGELGALGAVVDADEAAARREGEKFAAPALTLEAALAAPAIAGIAIAAPAEHHAAIALAAFNAGKHVYVEKPIALTLADGERMQAAALAAKRVLMVGHLLQYHPAFVTLLGMVRAGELGALRYAYSNRLSLGKVRLEENALWSFAPHDVSMLLALFGAEPAKVTGSGGAYLTPGIEDEYRLDMHFADGRHAHVFASWLHPFKEHRLVVIGEKAMAVFEDSAPAEQKLRLYRHQIDASARPPLPKAATVEPVPYPAAEPLKEECAHFIECVRTGATPRTDGAEGLRVLRVLTQVSA